MLSKLFLIAFLAVWSVALSFTVRSGIHMGGAAGFKSTKAGKEAVVGELKTLLDSSTVIFGVNTARRTPKQLMLLRRSLPEGTKFMVCKVSLLTVDSWNMVRAGLPMPLACTSLRFAFSNIHHAT